jgi:hypothetical protein
MREVRAIPSEAVPAGRLELLLSRLLRLLETEECTVDRVAGNPMTIVLGIPSLSQDRMHELRSLVGEGLVHYALEPRSMRALQLELQPMSLRPAAGAGEWNGNDVSGYLPFSRALRPSQSATTRSKEGATAPLSPGVNVCVASNMDRCVNGWRGSNKIALN